MHSFVIPSLIGMALLVFFLWPSRRQSRLGAWLAGLGAIGIAAGLWAIALHVVGMPQAAAPIPGQDSLVYKVLAASSQEAFLLSEDLVRISLPDGRITARYPNGKYFTNSNLGVLTSLAAERDVLLFTYHQGAGKGGWAAIRGDAWLVEPHPSERGLSNTSVFWDEEHVRFVLATFLRQESAAPQFVDRNGLRVQHVGLRSVDPDGKVSDEPDVRFLTRSMGFEGMCQVGGRRYAVDFAGQVCRLENTEAGVTECVPLEAQLK